MKREKPKKAKGEMKQVHFDMDIKMFLRFEKKVYAKGLTVSEYFRNKVAEEMKK